MTPEKEFIPADVDNYIFMVDSWLYGYIDGYQGDEATLHLSNLQHEDGSHATLTEEAVSFTARFSYTFRISPTDWSSYARHYLQVASRL